MIRLFLTDLDGCLTDGTYIVYQNGERAHTFHTRDWFGLKIFASEHEVAIVTGDHSSSVEMQLKRLNYHIGLNQRIKNKLDFIANRYIHPHGLYQWDEVAFIGDDVNDLDLLNKVGLAACPRDAVESVRVLIEYRQQHNRDGIVLESCGGKGCVREFIDIILSSSS
jgi:YrbI family 3-deoxy-D-manno-octulosonate 8-phosphate phosphatase